MIRVILHGCGGYMGRVVSAMIEKDPQLTVAAGIDITMPEGLPYPVYPSLAECDAAGDVLVDFSSAKAMDNLLPEIGRRRIPAVICTTGLDEAQLALLKEQSEKTAIFRSSNMSLGINTLYRALRLLAPALAEAGFDIEIVEKHHNRKLDAPSGTAYSMAEVINESLGNAYHVVTDRSARREQRDPLEIGIQAVRGGTIVGDHDVIFAGQDEVITLSHRAYSRDAFGTGALAAAKFLAGKPAGLYSFADMP